MQHTASLVQTAASRRSPALVAGVGAAFVASGITLSMMMSGQHPRRPRSRPPMVRKINARWFTVRCWPRPRAAAVRSGCAKAFISRLRLSSAREHSS